jgi:hypothetical protein
MGIYSTGKVYGLRWFCEDDINDGDLIYMMRFEKIFETEMTVEHIKEVKEVYDTITESDKFTFESYDECYGTLDPDNHSTWKMWMRTNKEELDSWFASKLK